ncbi:hypothetical protein ACFL0S_11725 [Thermodesulfobacteriota bacterium]
MEYRASHEVFDPGDYDPVFKFELELSIGDYLLLSLYLIFIAPLELLVWVIKRIYQAVTGAVDSIRSLVESKPQGGLLSVFSKLF